MVMCVLWLEEKENGNKCLWMVTIQVWRKGKNMMKNNDIGKTSHLMKKTN